MQNTIFYTIGIAFTSGIFIRSFFDIGYEGAALVLLIGVACLVAWRIKTSQFDAPLFFCALIFISTSLGLFRLGYAETYESPLRAQEETNVVIHGVIAREPEYRAKTIHLYVKPDTEESNELVLVTADRFLFAKEGVSYGDVVHAEGVLKKPEAFEADGGRTFDYPGYLRAKNVFYTLPYAKVHIEKSETNSFLRGLYHGKSAFMDALERAVPEPAAGLGEGVLLGVKRALGEDLERTFRETGIIHIVVLSGYNIMIVVEIITYVLAFLFFPRTRMFLGIGLVITFALLVGFSSTVLRASFMAILLIVARGTGRLYAVIRALMLALVGMLVWNPYLLVHDPGFQLSFLATLGLILFSPHIEKRLTYVPEKYGIRMFVTATIATQIAVLPLILYHMGLFSVVALVVNVLVLPMVPPAMGLTFLTGVLGLVSVPLGTLFGFFAYLSLMYIVRIAEFFGNLPFASFSVNAFPFWIVLVSYVLVGVGYVYFTREKQNEEENPYAGWIIEEEVEGKEKLKTKKEKSREAQSASGDSKSSFPFR
ncbi:ComEC/Rec2 family competence protein [Candidatus Kaiserbacteria bacterium]|nr:MAG: ComEC/Rec2 family competence protein [Candidatus Kaiserbacteria bacterium]